MWTRAPLICLLLSSLVLGQSRTTPPSGAIVVRQNTATAGEFSTISAAVASLPNDSSKRSIFVFPGTYQEQVSITRSGPLTIYGYTTNTASFSSNVVTISHSSSLASGAASDDLTGTLRVHKDNFSLYNVDVRNTFGQGSQAIAISAYGNKLGFYASRFFSYQDTVLANQGTQVYAKSYIEARDTGAVDFIFGQVGLAYFEGNTIASIGAGYITANGRSSNDSGIYIFNRNTLVLGSGASSSTNANVYLGRPWGDWARVIYRNTNIGSHLNKALWHIWNTGDERTDHVLFGTAGNTGAGASGVTLPSFATALSTTQANQYTIAAALGSDYTSWVDATYVSGG